MFVMGDFGEIFIKLDNGQYMRLYYSMNPPDDEKNKYCIGFDVYDKHMNGFDGGELDVTWKDNSIEDAIPYILEFYYSDKEEIKPQSYEITDTLKFF